MKITIQIKKQYDPEMYHELNKKLKNNESIRGFDYDFNKNGNGIDITIKLKLSDINLESFIEEIKSYNIVYNVKINDENIFN